MSKQAQFDLLDPSRIWQQSLLTKIHGLVDERLWENLDRCGKEQIFRTCKSCGDWEAFEWHCSNKFCPLCNYRVARRRAEILRLWTLRISQPKHLVLTMRNFTVMNRQAIRYFGRAVAKLRRNKVWKTVKGGCLSIEITNEGRGWHLHAHMLIDARWLDMAQLSIQWASILGQDFGIVKVKDCRGKDYLGEITKYVVKPAQLVSWPAEEIASFIGAIRGVRFFAAFGSLFKLQRQIKAEIEQGRPEPEACKCGCSEYQWTDEVYETIKDSRSREKHGR